MEAREGAGDGAEVVQGLPSTSNRRPRVFGLRGGEGHRHQAFGGAKSLNFSNGTNGAYTTGTIIGDMASSDPTCTVMGSHVHESHTPNSDQSANWALSDDPQLHNCGACFILKPNDGDSIGNHTRGVTWSVSLNSNQPSTLKVKHSLKCIQPSGGSVSNGAQIVQQTCSTSSVAQQVGIIDLGNGYHVIVFLNSNKCLDNGWSTQSGAVMVQWDCHWNLSQQWDGVFTTSYTQHANRSAPGQIMNINGASQSNGALLIQWPCVGQDNCRFSKN
jgi:hypothetical protein